MSGQEILERLDDLACPAGFNPDEPLSFLEKAAAETDAEKRTDLAINAVEAMLAAWPGNLSSSVSARSSATRSLAGR